MVNEVILSQVESRELMVCPTLNAPEVANFGLRCNLYVYLPTLQRYFARHPGRIE